MSLKTVQLKSKERELNTFKAILKQSLTNGGSNGNGEALNLNLNDVISQLNSASNNNNNNNNNSSLPSGTSSLSSSGNDLFSMNTFLSNQQQQQQQQQHSQSSSLNGNLTYLPKI